MPTFPIKISGQLGGASYNRLEPVSYDIKSSVEKTAVAAAKTGTLTTRTDANTGTLTMSASHGITTGALVFIFWSGGSRRSVVGTVATNSVPIDLGAGDDLPIATTAVTVCVAVPEAMVLAGNDLVAIRFHSTRRGAIQITDGSDAEHMSAELNEANGFTYIWWSSTAMPMTNPVAGDTLGKVKFGNGDSAGTNAMIAELLSN